jgi:hypothetical protein
VNWAVAMLLLLRLGVTVRPSLILIRGWLQYSVVANLTNRGSNLQVPSPS